MSLHTFRKLAKSARDLGISATQVAVIQHARALQDNDREDALQDLILSRLEGQELQAMGLVRRAAQRGADGHQVVFVRPDQDAPGHDGGGLGWDGVMSVDGDDHDAHDHAWHMEQDQKASEAYTKLARLAQAGGVRGRVIQAVLRDPGATQSDLARTCGLSEAAVCGVLNDAEGLQAGYQWGDRQGQLFDDACLVDVTEVAA